MKKEKSELDYKPLSSKTPRNKPTRDHFIIATPVEEIKDDTHNLSIKIYYCTNLGKVKGQLTISDVHLEFFPIECPENKNLELKQFRIRVDYSDITGFHPLQLNNNSGQFVKRVEKKNYMYDFYLQVDLSRTKSTA